MTAALAGGERSAARPGRTLPPGKTRYPFGWAPWPVWTGGKSHPHRDSIPDRPARSSVAISTEPPGPHVLHRMKKIVTPVDEIAWPLEVWRRKTAEIAPLVWCVYISCQYMSHLSRNSLNNSRKFVILRENVCQLQGSSATPNCRRAMQLPHRA